MEEYLKKLKAHYDRLLADMRWEVEAGMETSVEDEMELDSLDHFYDAGGLQAYTAAAAFASEHGFVRVADIGCDNGFQEDIFTTRGINYLGIEANPHRQWAKNVLAAQYPCSLPFAFHWPNTLAVSRLCVGYEAGGAEVYDALARQFPSLLVSTDKDAVKELEKRYGPAEVIPAQDEEKWYYFHRKDEKYEDKA